MCSMAFPLILPELVLSVRNHHNFSLLQKLLNLSLSANEWVYLKSHKQTNLLSQAFQLHVINKLIVILFQGN